MFCFAVIYNFVPQALESETSRVDGDDLEDLQQKELNVLESQKSHTLPEILMGGAPP